MHFNLNISLIYVCYYPDCFCCDKDIKYNDERLLVVPGIYTYRGNITLKRQLNLSRQENRDILRFFAKAAPTQPIHQNRIQC